MSYQSEYQKLMTDLNTALHHNPDLAQRVEGYIETLESQKKNVQLQYAETLSKLQETDYLAENQKKVIENTGKTENRKRKLEEWLKGVNHKVITFEEIR